MQLGLPFEQEAPDQFYFVRHKRARRYVMRVDNEGRVRITIPRGGSRKEATAFGMRHLEWIASERARVPLTPVSATEQVKLRRRATMELRERLLELAARHGLSVARTASAISARDGILRADGHICLNWRLLLMPPSVRDYVLVHELMHLRRMDIRAGTGSS